MSGTYVQPFSVGLTPILRQLVDRLKQRLNAGAAQEQLWTPEVGALALSKAGAYRVIFSFVGGPVVRSSQIQGQEAVARSIAQRKPTVRAEIRAADQRTSGLTEEDNLLAERVLHHLIFVLDEKFSGDDDYGHENWGETTPSPGRPNVIVQFDFQLVIQVHDDEYLRAPWTGTTVEAALVGGQSS